jgi:hypothetical protein
MNDLALDRLWASPLWRGDKAATPVHVKPADVLGAGDPIGPAEVPGSQEKE